MRDLQELEEYGEDFQEKGVLAAPGKLLGDEICGCLRIGGRERADAVICGDDFTQEMGGALLAADADCGSVR